MMLQEVVQMFVPHSLKTFCGLGFTLMTGWYSSARNHSQHLLFTVTPVFWTHPLNFGWSRTLLLKSLPLFVLQHFRWLQFKYRIDLKVLLLTFEAIHNLAP